MLLNIKNKFGNIEKINYLCGYKKSPTSGDAGTKNSTAYSLIVKSLTICIFRVQRYDKNLN